MSGMDAILSRSAVIPVVTITNPAHARPLATALVQAGLPIIEVTLRTPAALAALVEMISVPGTVLGAGTVLNERQMDDAVAAGARFLVSPGLTERLATAAADRRLPLLPGVASASDVMRAIELGFTDLKFFPAETSGGVLALRALSAPFSFCRFCPTGGLTERSAASYLELAAVSCVGGSWMASPELIEAEDWGAISRIARSASTLRVIAPGAGHQHLSSFETDRPALLARRRCNDGDDTSISA